MAQLKHLQSWTFELARGLVNEQLLQQMLADMKRNPEGFDLRRPVSFDCVCDLKVDGGHDLSNLLYPLAKLLADSDVNLRSFRTDKDELLGGLPPAEVTAELNLPRGLVLETLQHDLLQACPDGWRVVLKQKWQRKDDT